MGYQKIINLLDNKPDQPSKFKIKSLIEINDESQGIITKIIKLDFNKCYGQFYVIINKYVYLLKDLKQLETLRFKVNQIMALIRK